MCPMRETNKENLLAGKGTHCSLAKSLTLTDLSPWKSHLISHTYPFSKMFQVFSKGQNEELKT